MLFSAENSNFLFFLQDAPPPVTPSYEWFWERRPGLFYPYADNIAAELTSEYKKNPHGSTNFRIRGHPYVVNFSTMIQESIDGGCLRRVKMSPPGMSSVIVVNHIPLTLYCYNSKVTTSKALAHNNLKGPALEKKWRFIYSRCATSVARSWPVPCAQIFHRVG